MAPKSEAATERSGAADVLQAEPQEADFTAAISQAYTKDMPAILRAEANVADLERVVGAGFELTDSAPSAAPEAESPEARKARLTQAADAIEEAANGGLTGIGTDEQKLWDTIARLNAEEFAEMNEIFAARHGVKYAGRGERWDVMSELKDELSEEDLDRFTRMIADKSDNEVPAEFRTTGESLLKPGSELKVGEMNEITLPDGRRYDVYIPRNADSRAPVVVAMHGAGAGDGKGVMAIESGLTLDAEKTGSIVVFAYPKVREFDTSLGGTSGVAWNVPGRTDLTVEEDDTYDDRVYMDNVLADLGTKTQMADKVGMLGFSDGGRFAQVYGADRPDRVAGVVSLHGTWMEHDAKPEDGLPVMIVHGTEDETLPYNGGLGSTSRKMEWLVDTNLEQSKPFMQAQVWSAANGFEGDPTVTRDGDVELRTYSAGNGNEVKEYIVHGADHGLHDFKNNGSRAIQWLLGQPELRHNFSLEGTRFLKRYITRDLS